MSSASWPLQQAIYAALTAALDPVPVYDAVPADAAFPYAVLGGGNDVATDWSAVAREGEEIDAHVHVWSRYAGSKEVKELMAAVKGALHGRRLTVEGHCLTAIQFSFGAVMDDPDGITRHGVMRFTARLRRA